MECISERPFAASKLPMLVSAVRQAVLLLSGVVSGGQAGQPGVVSGGQAGQPGENHIYTAHIEWFVKVTLLSQQPNGPPCRQFLPLLPLELNTYYGGSHFAHKLKLSAPRNPTSACLGHPIRQVPCWA